MERMSSILFSTMRTAVLCSQPFICEFATRSAVMYLVRLGTVGWDVGVLRIAESSLQSLVVMVM